MALLAFNKIVTTHPYLVAEQEDVIMDCIDSPDITIRIKALDLVQGMVSSDNLVSIVSRLMRQLKNSSGKQSASNDQDAAYDSDDGVDVAINPSAKEAEQAPPLPEDYRLDVIGRILEMCSQNNYSSLVDFEWYIDILTQLVRTAPVPRSQDANLEQTMTTTKLSSGDISEKIGDELRSVAVKVRAVRPAALMASELILKHFSSESSVTNPITSGAIRPVSWIVGEYADHLASPEDTLGYLLQLIPQARYPDIMTSCLQAIIKIFSLIAGSDMGVWTSERKARVSLLLARVIHVFEPLASHPNLEVQERAVEFTELLKLTAEAVSGQPATNDELQQDAPLLLTQAIPSLFTGWELNSVAHGAQKNVPLPEGLDLDEPIHPNLNNLLSEANALTLPSEDDDEFEVYYHQKPPAVSIASNEPAIKRLADAPEEVTSSYQQAGEESYLDPDILARRRAERLEKNRDDPFYIGGSSSVHGTSTPIHNILHNENGENLDIDSIPIMQLDLNNLSKSVEDAARSRQPVPRPRPRQKVIIAADENLAGSGLSTPRNYESENNSDSFTKSRAKKLKQSLLQVDSSHIGSLSLEGNHSDGGYDFEQQKREDAEMAKAMKEVERLRLEMQRASQRIQVAQGVPVEGAVVKKKKTKKPKAEDGETVVKKKKKKKPVAIDDGEGASTPSVEGEGVKPRKKKAVAPPAEIQEAA